MKELMRTINGPAAIMVLAVTLYALYPPISNRLVQNLTPVFLAFAIHSVAAVAGLTFLLSRASTRAALRAFRGLGHDKRRTFSIRIVASGLLLVFNHVFLFQALSVSDRYDVTAILLFETWPLLFFLADAALSHSSRKSLQTRDYFLVLSAFTGFAILTVQNIDLTDWLLMDLEFLIVIAWAMAGSVVMTLITFVTRGAIRVLQSGAETGEEASLLKTNAPLLAEVARRVISSTLLGTIVFASASAPTVLSLDQIGLIFGVGAISLFLGSALYYTALTRADNAAVGVIWYLMPIISLFFYSVLGQNWINEYEAIAATLIVSANVLLNLTYPVASSFSLLYFFMVISGTLCVFFGRLEFDRYFEVVGAATIFYGLFATNALSRIANVTNARDTRLFEFRAALETADWSEAPKETTEKYAGFLRRFATHISSTSSRVGDRLRLQQDLIALSIAPDGPRTPGKPLTDRAGQLLMALGDRITGGEYIVLLLLATINVVVILFTRSDGFVYDLFAFSTASTAAYLLFFIYERDRLNLSKPEQLAFVKDIRNEANRIDPEHASEAEPAITTHRRFFGQSFVASVAVIGFVFVGYVYAIGARSWLSDVDQLPEGVTFSTALRTPVVVGEPGWPSASIRAHLIATIADEFLGIDVELKPGSTAQIIDAIHRGQVDLHPEVWEVNVESQIRRYVQALGTINLTPAHFEGRQGLCINAPALEILGGPLNIDQLADPGIASVFDLDGDGKGDLWYGAAEWESAKIEQVRALGFGIFDSYSPLLFGEKLLFRSLQRYSEEGQPFLFHCYSPNTVFDRYGAVFVDDGAFDAESWERIELVAQGRPVQRLDGSAWPSSPVSIAYANTLDSREAQFARFLRAFDPPQQAINEMTFEVVVNDRDPAELVQTWVAQNADIVDEWVVP